MSQIHIKLFTKAHNELKKKAEKYHYSIQEFAEKVLTAAVKDPSFFSSYKHMSSDSESLFAFIDLFAGIGGIRMAFEEHDGACIFFSEYDRWCQKTYFENFGEMPEGDINEIGIDEIPDHDILAAGFPCQPFSIAGVMVTHVISCKEVIT